jgi:hypothetical protein
VPYYRTRSGESTGPRAGFFEFVVPMIPPTWLEEETAQTYVNHLRWGERPTALAVSILEVREPAMSLDELEADPTRTTTHWCLAHYLLDGHHKMWAASRAKRPLTLLSFLAVEQGIASQEDVERCVAHLTATSTPDE